MKKKNSRKKTNRPTKKSKSIEKKSSSFSLDKWLLRNEKVVLLLLLALAVLLQVFLFEPHIVLMADDSEYVMNPYFFVKSGRFPTSHATYLYYLVLSIPALIWKMNIIGVKVLSVVWGLITIALTYYTFRKLVKPLVLVSVLFIQATNFALHELYSSTLSESFHMMIQMIFIYTVYRYYDKLTDLFGNTASSWMSYALGVYPIVLSAFAVSISRSIGLTAGLAVMAFLLSTLKWRNALVFSLLFFAHRELFSFVLSAVLDVGKISHAHSKDMFLKHTSRPEEGNEDVFGLINRMFENLEWYFSSDILRALGFRKYDYPMDPMMMISLVFLGLFLFLLVWTYLRKDKLYFLGLYIATFCSVSFLVLQSYWRQSRLILVVLPIALLFFLGSAMKWIKKSSFSKYEVVGSGFLILLCAINLNHLPRAIDENREIVQAFMQGDKLYAYTPDWQNYIAASIWAGENLSDSSKILSRKPATSSLYSNDSGNFAGRFVSTQKPGAEILEEFKKEGITHILLANLRLNPAVAVKGQVIGTIHSFYRSIYNHDPSKLKLIKQFGNDEPAYLFEIVY